MRRLALVLVLATAAWSCGPIVDPDCLDRDMDGVCFADDSDDNNASCGSDGTDADGDRHCVGFDCDDSAATGATCFDGCTDVWADADGDGFGDPSAARGACVVGGPGVVAAGGLADCDDTPDSGRTRVPIDFDGDGVNACDDCDERDVRVFGGNVERCDGGLDNDCDAATDETTGDPDNDGILGCADLCPMQAPPAEVPTEIVWEWLSTTLRGPQGPCACSGEAPAVAAGTVTFLVNNTLLGATVSKPEVCDCTPTVQQFTTPVMGWVPASENTLTFDVASDAAAGNDLVAWMRARIRYPNNVERTLCVFDQGGGDCTEVDLCAGTFCDVNATCAGYPVCAKTEFSEPTATDTVDNDGDGVGAACDCDDRAPGRSPDRLEICTNGIDDDCDGNADALDDECATCRRTTTSELNLCANDLDDDCDGAMDHEDPDCAGTVCPAAQPIELLRDSMHERRTGSFDLCRMGPDDTANTVCGRTGEQRDHWQLVTVHDPRELGYRVEYCFDGVPGELLTSSAQPYACGENLTCAAVFTSAGPNNCVIEPATGSFVGTRTMPVAFRGLPSCSTTSAAMVSWRITVLPP